MVDCAVETYGRLDCAFNNAGHLGGIAPVTGQSLADLDATMDVNVRGTAPAVGEKRPVPAGRQAWA